MVNVLPSSPGRLKTPTTKDIPASDRAKWRLRFGGWAHLRRENWLRINHSVNQPFKFDLGLTVGRDRLFTSPFCCCCCCRPVRYRVCAGFEFKSISSFFPYVNMQPSISGWACVEKWLKIRIQTVKRLGFFLLYPKFNVIASQYFKPVTTLLSRG